MAAQPSFQPELTGKRCSEQSLIQHGPTPRSTSPRRASSQGQSADERSMAAIEVGPMQLLRDAKDTKRRVDIGGRFLASSDRDTCC